MTKSDRYARLQRPAVFFIALCLLCEMPRIGMAQAQNAGTPQVESPSFQTRTTAEIYRSHNGLRGADPDQSLPTTAQKQNHPDAWSQQSSTPANSGSNISPTNGDVHQASYLEPTGLTNSIALTGNANSPRSMMQVEVVSSAIPLKPPTNSESKSNDKSRSWLGPIFSMGFSLTLVLGIFAILVWVARKSGIQQSSSLPSPVIQVLGRSVLAPRQQLYVLRFGPKLLLVSHQLGQTQTLSEIEDPVEVERITAECNSSSYGSNKSFKQVFQEMAQKTSSLNRDSFLRASKSGSSKGLAAKG
jgi:flagellar biogenesis protein FliO